MISGEIQEKEQLPPLHLLVAIEKGSFGLPSTTVSQLPHIYDFISDDVMYTNSNYVDTDINMRLLVSRFS